MRRLILPLSLVMVASIGNPLRADEPIPIRVLYAGNPGSPREKDFVAALKPVFRRADSTDYQTFKEEQAKDYDVIIFDWTSIYPRDQDGKVLKNVDELKYPKSPMISEKYDRPTILVGYAGVRIAKNLRLKIDWRCLCLDRYAHAMATDHEIFRTPLEVSPSIETLPTPPDMINPHYASLAVGRTIRAWKVQSKDFPELDPGMLSNETSFEDTPDAEIIASGGLSSRGLGSVSLGRHGNFFLWGYSASPSDMTPEGRRCFTNAVCYIKKFDGQKPIAHLAETPFSRKGALLDAEGAQATLDPELFKRRHPTLASTPEGFEKQRKIQLYFLNKNFPEAVKKRAASDPGYYLAWVKENFDWIYPGPADEGITQINVDEDVKAVGPPNNKVELIEACVKMIEANDRPDLASRVLRRYTVEDFADAKSWRNWFDENRSRIFFTEAGGYKFLVAPRSMTPPNRLPRIPLSAISLPTPKDPVVAELVVSTTKVHAGESFTLIVRVQTAPSWHIAALGGSNGPEVATSLKLNLPACLTPEGEWTTPEPIREANGHIYHEGSFEFRRLVRLSKDAPAGPLVLSCKFGYQACDPSSCRPPAGLTVETELEVVQAHSH